MCELRPWEGRLDPKNPSHILFKFLKSVHNLLWIFKSVVYRCKNQFLILKKVQSCAYKLVVCTVPNCGYNCIRRAALRLHCIRGAKHICEICMRSAAAFGKQIFLLIFVCAVPALKVKFVCAVLCCGYNLLLILAPGIQMMFISVYLYPRYQHKK